MKTKTLITLLVGLIVLVVAFNLSSGYALQLTEAARVARSQEYKELTNVLRELPATWIFVAAIFGGLAGLVAVGATFLSLTRFTFAYSRVVETKAEVYKYMEMNKSNVAQIAQPSTTVPSSMVISARSADLQREQNVIVENRGSTDKVGRDLKTEQNRKSHPPAGIAERLASARNSRRASISGIPINS